MSSKGPLRLLFGSDHRGVELRVTLIEHCRRRDVEVEDLGPPAGSGSVDYPDLAHAVCDGVLGAEGALGVLICGTGIGMSIAANKHDGIRAALVSEPHSAALARRHNDANVLCFGAGVVGSDLASSCLDAFLDAAFEGGRHSRRLGSIGVLAGSCGAYSVQGE